MNNPEEQLKAITKHIQDQGFLVEITPGPTRAPEFNDNLYMIRIIAQFTQVWVITEKDLTMTSEQTLLKHADHYIGRARHDLRAHPLVQDALLDALNPKTLTVLEYLLDQLPDKSNWIQAALNAVGNEAYPGSDFGSVVSDFRRMGRAIAQKREEREKQ